MIPRPSAMLLYGGSLFAGFALVASVIWTVMP